MTPPDAAASDRVLQRLMRLHPKVIDLSLDRVWRLLAALGHPERGLPPTVHVAGTNGKGSTLAFLRAMLEAQGYRVHVYTSPHLVRFHERIRLAGRLIAEDDLIALLEAAERANGEDPITYFEVTTCAAFLAFAREPADVLLLETGLGGRLDATNVLDRPALTAITPIGMDHMQFLGDTLEAIAGEKAGILKPGRPAVFAPQKPRAARVLHDRAAAVGAPTFSHGTDWTYRAHGGGRGFRYDGGRLTGDWPAPSLLGPYQIANAAMALACAERLEGFHVGDAAARTGLARASWPGRMQQLADGPLAARLPAGWELWLDGGHNADAGAVVAAAVDAWQADPRSARPLHVVFGMLNSKQPVEFLTPLVARADSLTAVAIPGEQASHTAAESAGFARQAGATRVAEAADVAAALDALARGPDSPPARVLICGSLYLAGKVLALDGA
ncbi:bifunctional folylpolyglutamate synthase/dihydrofolate synthase [Rhodovibrio sodomensis]|uniref:Bifunctional folylpolyglutamate synthase/dihydrofolate synthase n=1 Tax=Rhodovibrio sodomensis TaxID=1088 RepID=A0ABS1D8M4_9PROT|nr:folylpolyglutamate synthase/dihydrofolate synthase family protein [Rhodovibrio sodomensis]MBK1666774.1 bifunctional folylpolyglutamate synthase/dihydrofolate synthase [Rhodovibrio sodomensis]